MNILIICWVYIHTHINIIYVINWLYTYNGICKSEVHNQDTLQNLEDMLNVYVGSNQSRTILLI